MKIKKLSAMFLSIAIFSTIFIIPISAADPTFSLNNFKIKARQEVSSAIIEDNSAGSFLFLRLYANGNVADTVSFWGTDNSSSHRKITGTGDAKEGNKRATRVNYTDGNDATGRVLYSVKMKSKSFNWSDFTVNGLITY